jgi:hypothetical protein
MYNWLGQKIEIGTVVGRGARNGNSSTFKVGVVTGLNEDKQTARVAWKFTPRSLYRLVDTGKTYYNGDKRLDMEELIGHAPSSISWATTSENEKGRHCSVDSLFVLDQRILQRAEVLARLVVDVNEGQRGGFPITRPVWEKLVAEVDKQVAV